jgi:hypothetical protein
MDYSGLISALMAEELAPAVRERIAWGASREALAALRAHSARMLAVRLLQQRERRATIAARLMADYGMSRSTCYRILGQALALMQVNCRPGDVGRS